MSRDYQYWLDKRAGGTGTPVGKSGADLMRDNEAALSNRTATMSGGEFLRAACAAATSVSIASKMSGAELQRWYYKNGPQNAAAQNVVPANFQGFDGNYQYRESIEGNSAGANTGSTYNESGANLTQDQYRSI